MRNNSCDQLPPKSHAIMVCQLIESTACHGAGDGAPVMTNSGGNGTLRLDK